MNARQIIDYAAEDNAKDFRESLYAAIYDKVNAHIESKKQEIAHGLVTQEEKVVEAKECECDDEKEDKKEGHEDEKEDKAMIKKMVKKDALKTEEVEEIEEAVSRKHFQMVADVIKSHEDHDKRKELAQHHATIFAAQNPRFDRAKFMKAANVQE